MRKPDILFFLSDQHHAGYAGFAGHSIIQTPHLDQLAAEGTVFDCAYTSSPLCVPARVSMLTGQLPRRTGVYNNSGAVPCDQATFLHGLAAEGYETVLCGRMHFLGEDQRHGFTKRIMGETTPLFWGRYGKKRTDLGPYAGTMDRSACLSVIGGGNSPVLEYDRAVIRAALEYLQEAHDKPQCIVVGTYGPHHTFVAPPELYTRYKPLADIPASYGGKDEHPAIEALRHAGLSEDVLLKLRAAYFGMVAALDEQIGQVREAWRAYLKRSGRKGVFVYASDHGEQAGEHGLVGKSTFYEGSARIPMLFEGDGVAQGRRVAQPVSLMDIGPTLCELAGAATPPRQDGKSLAAQLQGEAEDADRMVISETIAKVDGEFVLGRMLRKGKWKFVSYSGCEEHDQLFDLEADPLELNNLAESKVEVVKEFIEIIIRHWNVAGILDRHKENMEHYALLSRWGAAVDVPEPERWVVPEEARALPVIV